MGVKGKGTFFFTRGVLHRNVCTWFCWCERPILHMLYTLHFTVHVL